MHKKISQSKNAVKEACGTRLGLAAEWSAFSQHVFASYGAHTALPPCLNGLASGNYVPSLGCGSWTPASTGVLETRGTFSRDW